MVPKTTKQKLRLLPSRRIMHGLPLHHWPRLTSNLHPTPEVARTVPAKRKGTRFACCHVPLTYQSPHLNASSPARLCPLACPGQQQHLQRSKAKKHAERLKPQPPHSNSSTPHLQLKLAPTWPPASQGRDTCPVDHLKCTNKNGCLELHQKLIPKQ